MANPSSGDVGLAFAFCVMHVKARNMDKSTITFCFSEHLAFSATWLVCETHVLKFSWVAVTYQLSPKQKVL